MIPLLQKILCSNGTWAGGKEMFRTGQTNHIMSSSLKRNNMSAAAHSCRAVLSSLDLLCLFAHYRKVLTRR